VGDWRRHPCHVTVRLELVGMSIKSLTIRSMASGEPKSEQRKRYERRRRIVHRRRWLKKYGLPSVVISVVVLALGLTLLLSLNRQPEGRDGPTPRRDGPPSAEVVVFGDSFTSGSDQNEGPEWPAQVADAEGWSVQTSAPGGSGYIQPGINRPLPARVPTILKDYPDADLYIFAAGLNDVGNNVPADQIATLARVSVDELRSVTDAPLVLTSPFSSGPPVAATDETTAALQAVCANDTECTFIDVSDWLDSDLIGTDGVHPTDAGHAELARRFEASLPALV